MKTLIRDSFVIAICIFLSSTQLKVLFPFLNSLVLMGLGLALSFVYYRGLYKQEYMIWVAVYFVVLLSNNLIGDSYFKLITNVAEEMCLLLFPAAFSYYIIYRKKYKVAKWLVYSMFFLIIYSSITTFIVNSLYPDAVRSTVALMENEESSILRLYYGMGMVSYRFCHALPVMIPALFFTFWKSKQRPSFRIFAFVTLLSLLLIVYIANATTALLLSLFTLLFSISVSDKGENVTNKKMIFLTIIAIPLFLRSDLLVDVLDYFSSLIGQDYSYKDRVYDIQNLSESGVASGDLGGRINRYAVSWSLFEGNFAIGSDFPPGGHSALLDRLACLGLIGWIPYMLYVIKNAVKLNKLLPPKVSSYYFIGAGAALLMLATKNMSNWDIWFMFFCFLPVLLWYSSLAIQEVEQLKRIKE